jgi:hypothetical protein
MLRQSSCGRKDVREFELANFEIVSCPNQSYANDSMKSESVISIPDLWKLTTQLLPRETTGRSMASHVQSLDARADDRRGQFDWTRILQLCRFDASQ